MASVAAGPVPDKAAEGARPLHHGLGAASLGALGVVYGDIGTSPLYALKEAAKASTGGGALTEAGVLAATSAIVWSLIVVVAIKYALLILRADNRGEGGIMAMLAILHARTVGATSQSGRLLLIAGLVGAALLYGDGAITPAVSVLSAVEGLKADAPALTPLVVPITVVVIALLFIGQRFGTGRIGRLFGPIMLVWFLVIGVLGLAAIGQAPRVALALNPLEAVNFLLRSPFHVSAMLVGAAFLAVTGGEAMYADLGHFGARAIRAAWFAVVMPALVLNYLGQGAALLTNPKALSDPFWSLAPSWFHYPLVAFATIATVIASQSIISGAFSLTRQAIQLGFLPRLHVVHTDAHSVGQVYLPLVNAGLAIATIAAVLYFGSSDALAGAYGIAVSLLMVITTLLATLIARQWRIALPLIILANGAFLIIDLSFFAANAVKIEQGGWFPLGLAAAVAITMLTWRRGQQLVDRARATVRQTPAEWERYRADVPADVNGRTGAFLTSAPDAIPLALTRLAQLTGALPERILLVSIVSLEIPVVSEAEQVEVRDEPGNLRRVTLRYGFTDPVNVPRALDLAVAQGKLAAEDVRDLVYYIGGETVIPSPAHPGMADWRERLFAFMHRNSERPATFFCIPPARVIDVGTELEV